MYGYTVHVKVYMEKKTGERIGMLNEGREKS
jgi:hypothetical protein